MNDVRTTLLPLRRLVVASLALALAPACGLTPSNTNGDDTDGGNDSADSEDTTNLPTGDDGGSLESVTIYDLQQNKVPDKTLVGLKNVVVTSPIYMSKKNEANFFIAEMGGGEYSGIQVYVYADVTGELDADDNLPQPGDILDIRGVYQEFFDYSELTLQSAGDLTITGAGPVPAPTTVKAADIATGGPKAENFEGCLVQLENAEVTAPVVEFGQFTVDGSLLVDDQFFVPNYPSPDPPKGTKFTKLIGLLTYNFEEFKLIPRTCEDFQGWDGCSMVEDPTGTNPGCTKDAGEYTIYQLQQDTVCLNTPGITVTGAVVTTGLTFKKDGFYIQDPMGGEYSGMFVYLGNNNPNMVAVKPGDIVTINGTFDEYFDASQLKNVEVEVTGTTDVPAPAVVDTADIATGGPKAEAYEGVLVQVNDVTVVADDLESNEWSVDDNLRIDDQFFVIADWVIPPPGTKYDSIAGPLEYSFENHKIAPRNADDLKPAP